GVSTVVPAWSVLASLLIFTLLYAALGAVWFFLMRRYVREGIESELPKSEQLPAQPEPVLSFAY
ncbi:MAG: cytochrome ubiquinol oxidase subunit I, partial [Cellulomonas sp.]|nr:cytochrome ubiquinol oxidase subunit I [Cellulomonas sp.]